MQLSTKVEFTEALLEIYKLEAITELVAFLQGEQAVLFALSIGGVLYPSQISDKLNLTRSRTSMIISSLKNKGLILLKEDEKDRRRTNVKLSDKGLELITKKQNDVLKLFDYLLRHLGEEKVAKFTALLNETVAIMEGAKNEFK